MNRGLRVALVAGLSGMLLIFTVAAFDAVRLLHAMRAENQALRQDALVRSRKLATVRSSILVSQTWLGDSEGSVRETWTRMLAQLSDYPAAGTEDAARFRQLHEMLEKHWALMEAGRADVGRLRVSALAIDEQLEDVDARQSAATEAAVRNEFEGLGRGLAFALNLALAAALLVAVGCTVYVTRIERLNRNARAALEGLSARLVDAQETERRTISRELHDQVGQTLNAVLVDAANLARRLPADDSVSRGYLDNIRAYADASVNSIRDIALLLRPSMLDDLGLLPALEWQAREVSRRTGIDIRVVAGGVEESLPDAVRTCIYRIAQEALQNVARHSGAKHARVIVKQAGRAVTLQVEDDGTGFDPARTRGMGLLGMEERVRQLGGRLEVKSEPGKGTVLAFTLLTE
jgi:signal transduction histidine kinase